MRDYSQGREEQPEGKFRRFLRIFAAVLVLIVIAQVFSSLFLMGIDEEAKQAGVRHEIRTD